MLKGDEYIVTGQKVWTTFAHQSKWCMLLARTNPDAPKHRGLTYFLMDMEQDGVEVRPLVQITGEAEFNELFIEEARIPVENVVGGVDNGWRVAITTLMHERAGLAFALQARVQIALGELVDELKGAARRRTRSSASASRSSRSRPQVLRLLAYRGLTTHDEVRRARARGLARQVAVGRHQPGADRRSRWTSKGPRAQLVDDAWTYRFLRARANSIEGGTTEILQEHRRRARPGAAARMNFDLTEDQREIQRTAREFLAARYTPEKIRAIALDGAADPHWDEIVELGWPERSPELGIVELARRRRGARLRARADAAAATWAARCCSRPPAASSRAAGRSRCGTTTAPPTRRRRR